MPGASPLAGRLARRIEQHGPVTVAEYMVAALTDPECGYYMRQDPLGMRGDFITAPEVSQMFGEMIGLWCAETWRRLGEPAEILLVELGPGRGTLMADALRAAQVVPGFAGAVRLHLVEVSPALKARQAESLAAANPVWHEDFGAVPEGPMLVIANEFFDALPVRQFVKDSAGWRERLVTLAEGAQRDDPRFAFALSAPSPLAGALIPAALRQAPPGAVFEASPAALSLTTEIGRRLAAYGGAAVVIDYGHGESATGETLQAVRHHAPYRVLEDPGGADLTCHVDFAALARAARDGGAEAHGPLEQGLWLCRLGIEARAARLMQAVASSQKKDLRAALARLIDPAQMGRLFKTLALVPPGFGPPAGFA